MIETEIESFLKKRISNKDKLHKDKNNDIFYDQFGPITIQLTDPFKKDIQALFRLIDHFSESFTIEIENVILFNYNGLKIIINDRHTLYALEELIVWKTYNFQRKTTAPFVVIDVGMNIGLSSLLFAQRNDVRKVYGFEPFPVTFERAKININNNPSLSSKITTLNYGLDDVDKIVTVPFNKDASLVNSTSKFFIDNYGTESNEFIEVEVKNSSHILKKIISDNVNYPIVLKLDCEGAEYNILQELQETDLIKLIDVFLIEWHYLGTEKIESILKNNNFSLIATSNIRYPKVGMVYAFKN